MLYYIVLIVAIFFIWKIKEIIFKTNLKNFFRLICVFTITLGFSSPTLAISPEERAINALLFEKKFDEAFEIANKFSSYHFSEFAQYTGYLLGSGVLSSGRDLCGAIENLEKAYFNWEFIRNDLNFLYGGDWAGIAAMEGNRNALFDMGYRIYSNKHIIRSDFDSTLPIKEAYKYFYNAGELGHLTAEWYAKAFIKKYPDIDFSKYKSKIQFKQILCSVRTPRNPRLSISPWQSLVNIDLK